MSYDSLTNTHNCYIGTKTESTNYLGETLSSWAYSATVTKCRMVPVTLSDRIEMGGRFEDIRYTGFFKSGASISLENRVRYNGSDYEVKECYYDSSHHHITTALAKL